MTKRIIFLLFVFAPFAWLSAQISETERIYHSTQNVYKQHTSIVRNYDNLHNVLMQYGCYPSMGYADTAVSSSSFMIQNTSTGDITNLFDLPRGYQVNDVRFVTLRRTDGSTAEDFCVFCGTRTQFEGIISLPNLSDGPSQYIFDYSKHGFAGFFSMGEALSPSAAHSAKVRDVEHTKELFRMVCYAEEQGQHYDPNGPFLDNAVLDIIGLDDTINAPSCFCRAKFYPNVLGGVRWDNNMRFNDDEILTDIALTDDYVVTSSHCTTGNTQWIRYSRKETQLTSGGLQLNPNVFSIDFTYLKEHLNCKDFQWIAYFNRLSPARICHTKNNGIEISYLMDVPSFGGLLNCQYDYNNGALSLVRGSYIKSIPLVKEMVYMPSNNATAFILDDNALDYVCVITWKKETYCHFPLRKYHDSDINIQSITLQRRNGFEHLFWSGKSSSDQNSPMYLMSQRGSQGNGYTQTCHSLENITAQPIDIQHTIFSEPMPIQLRFAYNSVMYPVRYINFNPITIEKEFSCVIE